MFVSSFKYYKSQNPQPSFKDVVIIGDDHPNLQPVCCTQNHEAGFPGFYPPVNWKIYRVVSRPGLLVIANPFTVAGQRYWMTRSVVDFPVHPNTINIIKHKKVDSNRREDCKDTIVGSWWEILQSFSDTSERRSFAKTLRWTTLGYQYDWTNKVYDEAKKEEFPPDLAQMVRFIAATIGYALFSPEAAIVNFYPVGSTLAGHTDHSEDDLSAPLFSLSFGQPAIFLIGGTDRLEQPDAILLRSGDIVVMTGASRHCYHAVPRICTLSDLRSVGIDCGNERWEKSENAGSLAQSDVAANNQPYGVQTNVSWKLLEEYIERSRININVRQVLAQNQVSLQRSVKCD
ncbi:nucleic acid dioxygenase ALKBH1 [Anopheles nili]|uniref:nucleic acid dioxygenase ALKBH1 n=1 Tax=Anopheles nili TaxID=185578 RepID=UPI00237AA1C0|nr:nucleic acid dioxygenase ALKBH1 [Anopheles nili]